MTPHIDVTDARAAFLSPRASRAQRQAEGLAQRDAVPLGSHAEVSAVGRDAVALLRAQESDREQGLVPIRYQRMGASPFAFLRGAAAVMADDLSRVPRTDIDVQLCGDAHVANFGMFASPDRRLVFDLNDFDETFPGPFEWDVKRLAASVVVAARHVEAKPKKQRRAAVAAVEAYRRMMRRLAGAATLDVWYARIDMSDLVDALRGTPLGPDAKRAGKAASRNTGDIAVGKLTEVVDGHRRFRSRPPLLVPVPVDAEPELVADVADTFQHYLATLPPDRAVLLLRYSFRDLAHKVVGVGSVGTRALALLMESGDGEHLVLQLKQANASVLEPYLTSTQSLTGEGASGDGPHQGRRVVDGQRLMQATGDPFLGWTRGGKRAPFDFYVRQLRDRKGSFDLDLLTGDDLVVYGQLCGAVLARAHARAGDASVISGYLGESGDFDDAVGAFAVTYADRSEADHGALIEAMRSGAVPSAAPTG